VHVTRFIIRDTVEERMLDIQSRKIALCGTSLAVHNSSERKQELIEELNILFQ
jgi:SNF2 family DNA or RNA helicase